MVETVEVYLQALEQMVFLVVHLDFMLAVVLEDLDKQVLELVVKVVVVLVTQLVQQILVVVAEALALMVHQQGVLQVEKELS